MIRSRALKYKVDPTLIRERRIKLVVVVALILFCLATLLILKDLLLSFIFAFVISYLLSPIADFLENRGLGRQFAVLIPFVVSGALIVLGIMVVLPLVTNQISVLESQLPKYHRDLMTLVSSLQSRIGGLGAFGDAQLSQNASDWIADQTTEISKSLPVWFSQMMTVLVLAPLFAFFMLLDGRKFNRAFFDFIPNNVFELMLNLHHRINAQLGDFIRARILESLIVGMLVWIGLRLLGFPYATLLSGFAGVMNLIPYIGPIFGAVPAIIIGFVSAEGQVAEPMGLNLLLISSVYLVAQIVDMVLIIPLLVAKIVNLHPVTVIIAIIIGAQIMGIVGMVISIPVASALKLIFTTLYEHLLESGPRDFDLSKDLERH